MIKRKEIDAVIHFAGLKAVVVNRCISPIRIHQNTKSNIAGHACAFGSDKRGGREKYHFHLLRDRAMAIQRQIPITEACPKRRIARITYGWTKWMLKQILEMSISRSFLEHHAFFVISIPDRRARVRAFDRRCGSERHSK